MNAKLLRRALLAHFDRVRRDLPWRGETDPYRVLVSEVMLQQTRVETVAGYYEPWLRRFPDLESLAAADVDDVLEAWAGLGYYRRARNLHRAARIIREVSAGGSHTTTSASDGGTTRRRRLPRASGPASREGATGPCLPSTAEALRALPGIGEYSAGAVASIAFGEPVPAVDGNVRRVLARLLDLADPKPARLRAEAAALVDPDRPGDWNQALMDLGATICTPRRPACERCPLAAWCRARDRGTQERRPEPAPKRKVPASRLALAVLVRGGRVMLVRRPDEGLLGGMWAFPEREVPDEREARAAVLEIARAAGLSSTGEPARLRPVDHRFTHLHATYLPWLVEVRDGNGRAAPGGHAPRWVAVGGPVGVALPAAQKRVLASAGEALLRGSAPASPGNPPGEGAPSSAKPRATKTRAAGTSSSSRP